MSTHYIPSRVLDLLASERAEHWLTVASDSIYKREVDWLRVPGLLTAEGRTWLADLRSRLATAADRDAIAAEFVAGIGTILAHEAWLQMTLAGQSASPSVFAQRLAALTAA